MSTRRVTSLKRPGLWQTVLGAVLLHGCAQPPARVPVPSRDPLLTVFAGRQLIYAHLRPTVPSGATVTPTTRIGVIDTFPTVQSPRHQTELLAARRFYDQGSFAEAAHVVEGPLRDESDNSFLLNEYARALFRIDSLRPQSRTAYERLVTILTQRQSPPPNGLVVDLWFVDAYWKLGMLYLDTGQYRDALIQFATVALAPQPDSRIVAQLRAYLAETYFYLGEKSAAQWYVDRTLELDPANKYVLRFGTAR